MPSRFEPCGLNQMYGMRYGTPPVVRRTGGLADSVTNASLEGGTGFVFDEPGVAALQQTIKWAIECYHDAPTFRRIQLNGMNKDVSWRHSAQLYLDLYESVLARQHQ
jgi:starch synthase